MKRFWQDAACVPATGGWLVQLDGKPLHVPGGVPLLLPSAALGEAVAEEWRQAGGAVGGETSYDSLALTRLAGTWQERVHPDPGVSALAVARYGESDLLCYRATDPEALVRREAQAWDPWLDWLRRRHGVALRVTAGLLHVAQAPGAMASLAAAVAGQPSPVLAALGVAVPALGSVVLGLALVEGALDADHAYRASVVDDEFQAENWGGDAEALLRAERVRADVALAARFVALSRA